MKNKKGGQPKHWSRQLKLLIWYQEVRRRTSFSDYALDKHFAYRNADEGRYATDDRPRIFENIRKEAREPKGRDSRWRSMEEIVQAVDCYRGLEGTAKFYNSSLWDLLQKEKHSPQDVQSAIDVITHQHMLVTINPDESIVLSQLIGKYGAMSIYDRCLNLALQRMDEMTAMVLCWLLFIRAEPSSNRFIRERTEGLLENRLEFFFAKYFSCNNEHWDYYQDSLHVLLNSKLDLNRLASSTYGYFAQKGAEFILPKDSVTNVSEKMLFNVGIQLN